MRGTGEGKWRMMENGRKNSVQTFSFRKLWPSERFKENSTDQVKALRGNQIDIAETQRAQKK